MTTVPELETARALARAHAERGPGPRELRARSRLAEGSGTDTQSDTDTSSERDTPSARAVPAGTAPDCARCADHCCRAPHQVSLRLVDVARLIDAGLGAAIAPPPPRARLPVGSPASAARLPQLRHTEHGDCVFLDADRRCAIYPIRPLTCRRFPYFIDEDATLRWAASCRSVRPALPGETAAHEAAALESWASKARELAILDAGPGALDALGIDPAHYTRPPPEPFDAVLARQRRR